jgi:hypothetical protein
MYDFDRSGTLTYSELRTMVEDLVSGGSLVETILLNMGIQHGTEINLATFISPDVLAAFAKFNLLSSNLLSPGAIVSMAAGHRESVVFSPDLVRLGTGVVTPIAPNVDKSSFAAHYKVHPDLISSTSWRGLLVNRASTAFEYANIIIGNAHLLAFNLHETAPAELEDRSWMLGLESMFFLTGKEVGDCARILYELSVECQRIVAAQEIVVNVRAPAKIFGDLNGVCLALSNIYITIRYTSVFFSNYISRL